MTAVKSGKHLLAVRMKSNTYCSSVGLVTDVCHWLTQTSRPYLQQSTAVNRDFCLKHFSHLDGHSNVTRVIHVLVRIKLRVPGWKSMTSTTVWNWQQALRQIKQLPVPILAVSLFSVLQLYVGSDQNKNNSKYRLSLFFVQAHQGYQKKVMT